MIFKPISSKFVFSIFRIMFIYYFKGKNYSIISTRLNVSKVSVHFLLILVICLFKGRANLYRKLIWLSNLYKLCNLCINISKVHSIWLCFTGSWIFTIKIWINNIIICNDKLVLKLRNSLIYHFVIWWSSDVLKKAGLEYCDILYFLLTKNEEFFLAQQH